MKIGKKVDPERGVHEHETGVNGLHKRAMMECLLLKKKRLKGDHILFDTGYRVAIKQSTIINISLLTQIQTYQ
jgi:hypothetical protein